MRPNAGLCESRIRRERGGTEAGLPFVHSSRGDVDGREVRSAGQGAPAAKANSHCGSEAGEGVRGGGERVGRAVKDPQAFQ